MNKVLVTFRNKSQEVISREEAENTILPLYEKYAKTRISSLVKINSRYVNIDQITMIEDIDEPKNVKLPPSVLNNPEYLAAVAEGKTREWEEARKKLLRLHKHNSRCVKENKLEEIIYFKYENYKVIKVSKVEAERRLANYKRKQIGGSMQKAGEKLEYWQK